MQIFKDFEPPVRGGIEHTIRLLSEGLAARGHQVSVLTSAAGPRTTEETLGSVHVVRVATFGRVARVPVMPTLGRWIRRLQPDVLHLHFPNPAGELACLLGRPTCPIVLTYHCDIGRQLALLALYRWPLDAFLKRVDCILVTSPVTLEKSPFLAPHRDRCRVIHSGVDFARVAETPRTVRLRDELRGRHPAPRILFVGRLRPYKGIPVLLEAMRELPGSLLLVGSGETEALVRREILRLGLESRVLLAGEVPDADLGGYYRAADVLVLSSVTRAEAFGLALVEAMHCGLPVVSTRLGTGTSYVNRDGVTGLEANPRDPRDLARAIRWILEHPDEARRMGAAGREWAARFTVDAMVDQTLDMYESLRPTPRSSGWPRGSGAGLRDRPPASHAPHVPN